MSCYAAQYHAINEYKAMTKNRAAQNSVVATRPVQKRDGAVERLLTEPDSVPVTMPDCTTARGYVTTNVSQKNRLMISKKLRA
jgi:hypothetical protein